MLKKIFMLMLIGLSVSFFSLKAFAVNFVSNTTADVLVVTHPNLRTPNWDPSMTTAWETKLLEQKEDQGLTVGILEVANLATDQQIQASIELSTNARYVIIVGDAHRDVDTAPDTNPAVNYLTGNFVPFFKTSSVDWARQDQLVHIFNDLGYIENMGDGVTIGRIPASTTAEISAYVNKMEIYLSTNNSTWGNSILQLLDDSPNIWNGVQPFQIEPWVDRAEAEMPSWTCTTLRTSNSIYQGFDDAHRTLRADQFEYQINNNTPGYITCFGTSGDVGHLVDWYYGSGTGANYAFTNSTQFSCLFGISCEIGGVEHYEGGSESECVVEKLLLQQYAGIIGAFAPNSWTNSTGAGNVLKDIWKSVGSENASTFADILLDIQKIHTTFGDQVACVADMTILYGDPTLPLPHVNAVPSNFISTNTTLSAGTYYFTSDLNVVSPATLTLDPGVTLVFAGEDDGLIINAGAGLDVNGTSSNPVTFRGASSADRNEWQGIHFTVSAEQSSLEYAIIRNAEIGIKNEAYSYRLYINNCEIKDCEIGISSIDALWIQFKEGSIHHCDKGFFATHPSNPLNYTTIWGSTINNCDDVAVEFNTLYKAYFCGNQMQDNELTALKVVNVDQFLLYRETTCPVPTNIFQNNGFGGNATSHPTVYIENAYMPYFKYTHIYNNAWGGLKMLSNVTVSTSFLNYINVEVVNNNQTIDPSVADLDMYEVYYGGKNQYFTNRNYNLYNDRISPFDIPYWLVLPTMLSVTPNDVYWGTTVADRGDALDRIYYPQGSTNTSWDIAPSEFDFADGGHLTSSMTEDQLQELLDQGLELMADTTDTGGPDGYAAAIEIFEDLLDEAYVPAIRAYGSSVLIAGGTAGDAVNYLNELLIDEDDVQFRRARDFYCAEIYAHGNDFDSAISDFEDLSESTEDVYDSIIALINAAEVERLHAIIEDINQDDEGRTTSGMQKTKRAISDAENKLEELYKLLRETQEAEGSLNAAIPTSFELGNAYPNPFNPTITVPFNVPSDSQVEIAIFNVLGQKVATLINQPMKAGYHSKIWNGKDMHGASVASGIYFIKMSSISGFTASKKVVMLK